MIQADSHRVEVVRLRRNVVILVGHPCWPNISSHLQKPDGKEYQVLPLLTDERGEFKHDIETLVLSVGVHELWVVDDTTNVSSNRVKFEVVN